MLASSSAERNTPKHVPSVLVEGKLLSGDALSEYAQQKGLCSKCLQHVTHKRERKRVGMLRLVYEWVALTVTDDQEGNYTVYKGYCLQPTCWTLQEVQTILGERPMIRSTSSRNRRKATPTRSRDSSAGARTRSRSRGRGISSGDAERSTVARPRSSAADLVENQEGGGSERPKRRSSLASEIRTPSTRNLEANSRSTERSASNRNLANTGPTETRSASARNLDEETKPSTGPAERRSASARNLDGETKSRPVRKAASTRDLAASTSHDQPTNTALSLDRRRQNHQRQTSDTDQSAQRQKKSPGSRDTDRTKLKRMAVPDAAILQQLCGLYFGNKAALDVGLTGASDSALWASLHKRYGGESWLVETRNGKIMTLLQLLDRTTDRACIEPSLALLSFVTEQAVEEENGDGGLVCDIVVRISCEFDRDDSGINSKKLAASTLFNILKAEEHSSSSQVLNALRSLCSSRRQNWIEALLDTLMFQDENEEQAGNDDIGTSEILYVVWNLLLSQLCDEEHDHATEDELLMKTIVGIAVSMLSSDRSVYGQGDSQNEPSGSFHLSETVLGLLATVAARGGATALAGRQHECLMIVCKTIEKYAVPEVMLQGAHAICHILTSYNWYASGETDENGEGYTASKGQFVEPVFKVVIMMLSYQENHDVPDLSAPVCRLLTALFESDDEMRSSVVKELTKGPMVVQSLVRMIDDASDIALAESACDILVFLLNKDFTSRSHLRQIHDIASKLIDCIKMNHASPFLQEHLCLIVEHLVLLQDHTFGQEIGRVRGLKVIGDLLLLPAPEISFIEAASRALIGVLCGVDADLLCTHQKSLTEAIVSVIGNNARVLEIQLAGLDVLHCLCLRADCFEDRYSISIPVLVESMENHLGSITVLTRCCSVIRMVASKLDDWTVFIETGAVRMIMNAMLVHPASTEFLMEGMATLKDLAARKSFRQHLNPYDAETAVVSLFAPNMHNPDVLALAFATLNNIAVDSRTHTVAPIQEVVLCTITSALEEFSTDESISKHACLLLKSYSYDESSLEKMTEISSTLIPLLMHSSDCFPGETSERARYIMVKLLE